MADAEAEAAFLSAMQTNENAGGYNTVGDDSGEQIESSDEYDPAQDVQDISLPDPQKQASSVIDSPNTASRPTSANPTATSFAVPNSANDQSASVERPTTSNSINSPVPTPNPVNGANKAAANSSDSPRSATLKARLPNDTIGIFEDRIQEDPKGDLEAWLGLIDEHRRRGKPEDTRKVYDRFFAVFPQAADQWIARIQLENEANNRQGVEAIFQKVLKDVAHLQLWCTYLNHIRRYFNIAVDKSGKASQTNHQAYDAVLNAVGIDKDAGSLWQDFVAFIKSGPGVLGQTDWQSGAKMDLLRKAYQNAIAIPTTAVEALWREYSAFENSLNKATARQFLQKNAPYYMTARSSFAELSQITRNLNRTTQPTLPPALGFEGHSEYLEQVEIWKHWLQWEKGDPLVLKDENLDAWKKRVLYVYKQALMALRFWPEMWYDAAEFCFSVNLESEGDDFLAQGASANPESCLLAFKRADRLELTTTNGDDDNSKHQRGLKVRQPYDELLDSLHALAGKSVDREKRDLARIEADFASSTTEITNGVEKHDDDDDDESKKTLDEKQSRIAAVKAVNSVQISILNRTITHAWIALMRAMQRMQGKGKIGARIGGSRQVFVDSRKRGRITSELWVAAAMLEFHNSEVETAKRLFERARGVFPEDEYVSLEFIKLLTNLNDHTNARVVFETTVNRLTQAPEKLHKAKPLFQFFHQFESRYGELESIQKLEARMKELFPEDPKLSGSFNQRFLSDSFDPTAIRPIISPAKQAKPKVATSPGVEGASPARQPSPVVNVAPPPISSNSPKRPLPLDDFDSDTNRPRKLARGESPLAGAAGRRLNQIRQGRQPNEGTPTAVQSNGYVPPPPPPPPAQLPSDIKFLLSIIPPASTYNSVQFKVDEMIKLIRNTPIPSSVNQLPSHQPSAAPMPSIPNPIPVPQYSQAPPTYYAGQPMYR